MALVLGSLWLLLLGLYGLEPGSCSWVSMAPALGSLWLLFLGLYGSCSWVSMAPALGSIRLHQVKVTSGHIKSQQVTSGRPTTGHGFAHEVAVHLTSILFLSLLLSSWSLLVSSGLF